MKRRQSSGIFKTYLTRGIDHFFHHFPLFSKSKWPYYSAGSTCGCSPSSGIGPVPYPTLHARNLQSPLCHQFGSKGMSRVSPASSLEITTHLPATVTPLHSIPKYAPLRAVAFLSEPCDCDRLAERRERRGDWSARGGTRQPQAPAIKPSLDEASVLP